MHSREFILVHFGSFTPPPFLGLESRFFLDFYNRIYDHLTY